MFGLMRFGAAHCSTDERRRRWRLHYCGTCKTMGRRYGQRSRLLLNHDAVFLSELLTALAPSHAGNWAPAYYSHNCFRLPDARETPDLLRYAGAATVLLSEYKVADHRADSGGWGWTAARRLLSRAFWKARADLRAFGFPLAECDRVLSHQTALEARATDVSAVAEPTAQATRMVFEHGARVAGLDDCAERIGEAGYRFGRLIYLLDAWEDFDRDQDSGAFNALRAAGRDRAWAAARIRTEASELAALLAEVGAPAEYGLQLRSAVGQKLGGHLRVLHSCRERTKQTVRERWRAAAARARELHTPSWAFAAVLAIAFLFPLQAKAVRTHSECLSLVFNLMAVGGLLAAVDVGGQHKHGCFGNLWNNLCGSILDCDECCCDDICCDLSCCECGSCCDCGSCDCGGCDCDC